MDKNKKIVIILVIAVLLAIGGSVAIYMFLTPQKTTIYVFKQNVDAGTVVTEDMLTPVQADSTIYYGGANVDASQYYVTGDILNEVLKSGDSLRTDVVKGMPFTYMLLTSGGGSKVEMQMDPSKIAITVPITNITGVTNELKPGSRVNVYVTGAESDDVYSTKLIFQNMRILSVNYGSNNTLASATLETTVDQSLELVYYASNYTLYFGLIDGSGYQHSKIAEPYYTPETGAVSGETTEEEEQSYSIINDRDATESDADGQ